MSKNESYTFFATGKPSAKFDTPGTVVTGKITEEPQMQQQTEPDGTPKVWKDSGEPMLQLVVTVQTAERDPDIEDDDGKRRIFIKGQMRTAVQQALRDSKCKGLDVGGTLTVTYTHDGERTNPAFSPPKQYVVAYDPPRADQAGFFGTGNGSTAVASHVPTASVPNLPPGITPEVWATLPPEAKAAMTPKTAMPEDLPPGMTPEVWATLTPEARTALASLVQH